MADERRPVVFCVDDEADMLAWMQVVLSGAEWEIRTGSDPRRALEELRSNPPDLILMDASMPEMDGYQLCAALHECPATARVPVVFLTSLAGTWDRSHAFLAGAVDYLHKPISGEALVRAVRAHLETGRIFEEVMKLVGGRPSPRTSATRWDEPFKAAKFARFKRFLAERSGLSEEKARNLSRVLPEGLFPGAAELGIGEGDVTEAMSIFFPVPILSQIRPGEVRTGILPTSFCIAHQVLPVGGADDPPTYVVANPFDWQVLEAIHWASRDREPWISVAPPGAFDVLREWRFTRTREPKPD